MSEGVCSEINWLPPHNNTLTTLWAESFTYGTITFKKSQITVSPTYVDFNFSSNGTSTYTSGSIVPHPGGSNNMDVGIAQNGKQPIKRRKN